MKKKEIYSPYQTNKGGRIEAPKKVQDEPRSTVIRGDDLRTKKSGKGGRPA